ncbi:MAG: DUF1841 family protein [Gammaproteobacteria bacterium]|nr:DUF1841 family protein [Gammaproteobacteria bacterium]
MFNQNRDQMRRVFFDCWKAHQQKASLDAMQKIIVHIIELHPEYQSLLENEAALDKDFLPDLGEINPFLHMSMHIALHEQISTDRPAGIKSLYQTIISKQGSAHAAEHAMMDCLGEALWQAQRNHAPPDEHAYFECLKKLS